MRTEFVKSCLPPHEAVIARFLYIEFSAATPALVVPLRGKV